MRAWAVVAVLVGVLLTRPSTGAPVIPSPYGEESITGLRIVPSAKRSIVSARLHGQPCHPRLILGVDRQIVSSKEFGWETGPHDTDVSCICPTSVISWPNLSGHGEIVGVGQRRMKPKRPDKYPYGGGRCSSGVCDANCRRFEMFGCGSGNLVELCGIVQNQPSSVRLDGALVSFAKSQADEYEPEYSHSSGSGGEEVEATRLPKLMTPIEALVSAVTMLFGFWWSDRGPRRGRRGQHITGWLAAALGVAACLALLVPHLIGGVDRLL